MNWILDFGHGGLDNGEYVTPGKQFNHGDFKIYEGVINRKIGYLLKEKLDDAGIDNFVVSHEWKDNTLEDRVNLADLIYRLKDSVYLSIHSNSGCGKGFEVFTHNPESRSNFYADLFCESYRQRFPKFSFRGGKKGNAKHENFYVLRKTDMPAVLVENLFFDNREEAQYLLSQHGQEKIADCLFYAIKEIEKYKSVYNDH